MKQLSIQESFQRGVIKRLQQQNHFSKIPRDVSDIIHSFLASTEQNFCEYRMNFLLDGVLNSNDFQINGGCKDILFVKKKTMK